MLVNGTITNKKFIAEDFHDFFVNVGSSFESKVINIIPLTKKSEAAIRGVLCKKAFL